VGVGMGTVTILQAIQMADAKVSLPRMTVLDWPFAHYTGMMLDVARQFNSIETLKQCVVLARLYKMKYFHLHLTDDQIFTFPSTKYAAKLKGVYALAELRDLVKFADERGVTIIPEFEMPGHTSQLAVAFPDVFGDTQGCVINFLNPEAMPILTDLVNEMCDVFRSSPYFHMGSDECNWDLFEKWPNVVEDRKINKRGTAQQHGWLINEINKVVKKRGKSLIVWEGFEGSDAGVDKDVIVMEWDGRFFPPLDVAAAGYKMINVPWLPSIWATPRENYEWNMWLLGSQDRTPDQFKRGTPESDLVIGGMMQLWEGDGDSALPQLRSTAIPRHERVHSPDANKTYEDFDQRFKSTDQILDLLVHKFAVRADGLVNCGDRVFDKSLVLTIKPSPSLKNAVIRYTLDGTKPDTNSPVYREPIRITESTQFSAQAFDANGIELGFPRLTKNVINRQYPENISGYMFRPLSVTMKGLLPQERFRQNRYADQVLVTLKSAVGGEIRYTTDGSEVTSANAIIYDGAINVEKGAKTVRAAVFLNGKKQGEEWREDFVWLNYEKNLTTGKKAAAGQGMPKDTHVPASELKAGNLALDGFVDKDNHWGINPFPAWLEVDLEKTATIDQIHLYCWWGDDRSYQYAIELSEDGQTWKRVVEASRNTEKTTDQGYRHTFSPTRARYIRVTMLKNTANPAVHICELRAYEAK
jgi:hexosaminidase